MPRKYTKILMKLEKYEAVASEAACWRRRPRQSYLNLDSAHSLKECWGLRMQNPEKERGFLFRTCSWSIFEFRTRLIIYYTVPKPPEQLGPKIGVTFNKNHRIASLVRSPSTKGKLGHVGHTSEIYIGLVAVVELHFSEA